MESLLIIDGDFILYYATQGNKVLDDNSEPVRENNKFVYTDKTEEEVYRGVDDIIHNICRTTDIYNYIGFIGGKKCFRYDIYPEYKANRKNLVKPKFWQECKDYLIKRWNFEVCDFIEADDAVNITRNKLIDTYNSVIVTTDKDLIKCIKGTYLNPRDFEIYYTSENVANYNFWKSMVVGDSIDNIKGLPGCGIKFFEKLLNTPRHNTDTYEDLVYKVYQEKFNDEYYKQQYNLLKILDDYEGFVVPEVQTCIKRKGDVAIEWKE